MRTDLRLERGAGRFKFFLGAWLFLMGSLLLAHIALAQPSIPALSGRVVDQAEVLSASTEQQVSQILAQHEDATSNQIAVLTIPSLEGAVLEEYSLDVARSWALGQASRNNGVLLLVAVADRKMRIEVGYGLEGDLPDAIAKRIIDNDIKPFFRDGDFDGGVSSGVQAIVGAIEGSYTPAETGDGLEDMPFLFRMFFSFMFLGIPLIILSVTVLQPGCAKWFTLAFLTPFFAIGGTVFLPPYGGVVLASIIIVGFIGLQIYMSQSPKWQEFRKEMKAARKKGKKSVPIVIGGRTFNISTTSGSSSSSGGGSSFSSGGGSFGGGGASGSW